MYDHWTEGNMASSSFLCVLILIFAHQRQALGAPVSIFVTVLAVINSFKASIVQMFIGLFVTRVCKEEYVFVYLC